MKTRTWTPHVDMQGRTVPAEGRTEDLQTDPLAWATRGFVILALTLGSLGAGPAATSGFGSGDHARAHLPTGNIRHEESSYLNGSRRITGRPWMY
jgi:hypothetical protein